VRLEVDSVESGSPLADDRAEQRSKRLARRQPQTELRACAHDELTSSRRKAVSFDWELGSSSIGAGTRPRRPSEAGRRVYPQHFDLPKVPDRRHHSAILAIGGSACRRP
jgi:hypothetical protein